MFAWLEKEVEVRARQPISDPEILPSGSLPHSNPVWLAAVEFCFLSLGR